MKRRLLTLASATLGLMVGCGDNAQTTDYMAWDSGLEDFDEDGYYEPEDCDDEDPDVNPGADEICDNEIDDDCDGDIDAADSDCS